MTFDEIAKEEGFNVAEDSIHIWTPAGHDYFLEFDGEDKLIALQREVNYFDISEEAYLWLDSSGHGTNGAPYDMRDVYEDFEWLYYKLDMLRDRCVLEMEETNV